LISGFTQQEEAHEALCCLEQMQTEGLPPDPITLTSILKVCGLIGAIDQGERIHNEILSRKLLEKDIVLGTALVDMYARCGALARAQQVIKDLPARDIVTWNVLIAGYAQQGQGRKALSCFEWIQGEGLSPDAITFLSVLNACSHSGLLNVAQSYFTSIVSSRNHRIRLEMEHHVCMVVIYGCAGHFDKALSMIKAMPASNAPSVWLALLRACRTWGNVEVGKLAFDQAVKLQTDSAAAYVLMASIYAACGMHEDAEKLLSSKVYAHIARAKASIDDTGRAKGSCLFLERNIVKPYP
jgi:pentatricopeptide repeat protein